MALPASIGTYNYPYENSPGRSMIQGYKYGVTDGAIVVVGTIAAAQKFILTHLMVAVVDPTASSSVSVELRGDEIFKLSGSTVGSHILGFGPTGIHSAVTNTSTVKLVVTGNSVGASCFAAGYFDD